VQGIWWALWWFALAAVSALGMLLPRTMFRLFEAWKFTDPDAAELRDDILVVRSIQYMIGALAGLGLGLISLGVI
jgi:hypothetical protein